MSEMQEYNPRGTFSGIFIAILSAFVSVIFYALFVYLAYKQQKQMNPPQQVILQVTAAAVAVGMTQFLFRQVQGNKLQFRQGFFGGWMSSLILGIFVISFYSIFSKNIGVSLPRESFAMVLILYNLLGLIISFIFAFIFKKK
jgi:H+/Cl- antiporter ClcA